MEPVGRPQAQAGVLNDVAELDEQKHAAAGGINGLQAAGGNISALDSRGRHTTAIFRERRLWREAGIWCRGVVSFNVSAEA